MRPDLIDNVEIVDPPIEELTKRHRSFLGTCLAGAGCLVVVVIALFIAFRLLAGPGPTELTTVPERFPAAIPVYDKDHIERITFVSGRYKERGIAVALYIPRILLSSFEAHSREAGSGSETSGWSRLVGVMARPNAPAPDTIEVEWAGLTADPDFIAQYYRTELRKKNFRITAETRGDELRQLSFSGPGQVEGSLSLSNPSAKNAGTASMILTVNIPPQDKK